MSIVRAKVKCWSAEKPAGCEYIDVVLSAVTYDSPENKTWSKWTPSGHIRLAITNPDAFSKFVPGQEYFIDFVPVVKAGEAG